MNVFHHAEQAQHLKKVIVTAGTFDGVHLAHQTLLRQVIGEAKQNDADHLVMSFWPHPRHVLKPEIPFGLLSTLQERLYWLEKAGVENVLMLPFSAAFANLSAQEFVSGILVDKLHIHTLMVGYDHRFGNNRSGGFSELCTWGKEYGFDLKEIPRQDIDAETISSTKIRTYVQEGNMKEAQVLLGRWYDLHGKVVHGAQNGRKIGFPTANIILHETGKLLPALGVYAVWVRWQEKTYKAMMNIGYKPTFGVHDLSIEVHLIEVEDLNLYGENLEIGIVAKLRNEMKFDGMEGLIEQLKGDRESTLKMLNGL